MKQYIEYILLLTCMIPAMIGATNLTLRDYDERGKYDKAVEELLPMALSVAQGTPKCDVLALPTKTYTANEISLKVFYEHPLEGRFKILFKGKFPDGFRFEKVFNFIYTYDENTGVCTTEFTAASPEMEQLATFGGGGGFKIVLPNFTCN